MQRSLQYYWNIAPVPSNTGSSEGASTTGKPVMLTIGESCVLGFHVYKDTNSTRTSPNQTGAWESGRRICNSSVQNWCGKPRLSFVGHVPREFSRLFWYFLQTDGEITCEITVKGGLEIPCSYKFVGKKKHKNVANYWLIKLLCMCFYIVQCFFVFLMHVSCVLLMHVSCVLDALLSCRREK